jgi:hypothetical protein
MKARRGVVQGRTDTQDPIHKQIAGEQVSHVDTIIEPQHFAHNPCDYVLAIASVKQILQRGNPGYRNWQREERRRSGVRLHQGKVHRSLKAFCV